MPGLKAAELLVLWERGATRHALDRSALLAAYARPELPPETITELPLGVITEILLHLRAASFGDCIESYFDCRQCGERLELVLDMRDLLQPTPETDVAARTIEVAGLRVRTPSLLDLASVANETNSARAVRGLLERCTDHGDIATLSETAMREVEDALEAADPNADLAFTVHCETCGCDSTAQLDVGELLWDEIEARARALLSEVHLLARAYGWRERDILALSNTRRAAYLAMVDV